MFASICKKVNESNLLKTHNHEAGRPIMAQIAPFCRHPEDLEGCRVLLVQTSKQATLKDHCIFEGLRAGWFQCKQVLLDGLYRQDKQKKGPGSNPATAPVETEELEQACKEVALLGLPQGIKAVWDVFYEAYYKLVRSTIHRYGIDDNHDPSADDVFQNVFVSLARHFQKQRSIKARLSSYIVSVTMNECYTATQKQWRRKKQGYEDEMRELKESAAVFLPPKVVEKWEQLDNRLARTDQGDLINRIILALKAMEACSSGRKASAKLLKQYWFACSELSDEQISSLQKTTAGHLERFGSMGVVYIVADLANHRVVQGPPHVPVVFAAATGMSDDLIHPLLNTLNSLSQGAIHTRICRIYKVLQPHRDGE